MATGSALVPVQPADRPAPRHVVQRPAVPFLAHLIAMAAQAPQTRARRRVEPNEAAAAYRRALALEHPQD